MKMKLYIGIVVANAAGTHYLAGEELIWCSLLCILAAIFVASFKEKPKTCRVTFLRKIQHNDSHGNTVHLGLYEDGSGGLFAVDSSYLGDTDEPTYNPFTGELIDTSDL